MRRWIFDTDNGDWKKVRQFCLQAIATVEVEDGKPMLVTLSEYSPPRSLAQNNFYWSAMVEPLSQHLGYEKNEMHEVLLAEHFGTVKVGSLVLPAKRSSGLTKREMTEFLDWVPRFAAEQGVVLYV